jgi:uncharacterized membrane protein
MNMKRLVQANPWMVPLIYSVCALSAGLIIPRIEGILFPDLVAPMAVNAATAIYSSVASGMIALTGIVFSLTFVMVQFSATAFSPRLVLWLARDRVIAHALGVFIATFLYAVAALAGVDRSRSGAVPYLSVCAVVILLLGSVGMFVALLHRVNLLQINNMLTFTGNQGRAVIETLYVPFVREPVGTAPVALPKPVKAHVLLYHGDPRAVQAVDVAALVQIAKQADAVIEMVCAVGDTVFEATPLLEIQDAARPVSDDELRKALIVGRGRTFDQDPKYAIRLLVDIAIRALSPAVNDPTTAVQALDQIQDLLFRLGRSQLEVGLYYDDSGKLRLAVPYPAWDDFLRLAFDEICGYGSGSVQVMRRMRAVINDLAETLPQQRRDALYYWESRLNVVISRSFSDSEEQSEASIGDRQGLGIPRPVDANAKGLKSPRSA